MEVVQPRLNMFMSSSSSSSSNSSLLKSLESPPAARSGSLLLGGAQGPAAAWSDLAVMRSDVMEYQGSQAAAPATRVVLQQHMDAAAELDPLATDWLDPHPSSDELADVVEHWPNLQPFTSPLMAMENSPSCSTGNHEQDVVVRGPMSVVTSSSAAAACAAPEELSACNFSISQQHSHHHQLLMVNNRLHGSVPSSSSSEQHLSPRSEMQLPAAAAAPAAHAPVDFTTMSKCHKFEEPGSIGSFSYGSLLQQPEEEEEDPRWRKTLPDVQHWQQLCLQPQYTDFCNSRQQVLQPAAIASFFRSMADIPYDAQDARDLSTYPSSSSSSSSSSAAAAAAATHGLQAAVPLPPSIPPHLLCAASEPGSYLEAGLGLEQAVIGSSLLQSVHNDFKAAAATIPASCVSKQAVAITMRAARKSRMAARQRSHSSISRHHSRNAASLMGHCTSSSRVLQSCHLKKLQMQQDLSFAATQGQGNNMDALVFLLHKELRPSDVSNLGRIVLPKKEAEYHLPFLQAREGMSLAMEDFDSGKIWTFRYRFWPNNKSRMYLLELTGMLFIPARP
ncbi:hypothetical protein CY35_04G130100 [Sphagnum magellanicum]|nr:hypothetical protein CY35_04G130100 [Sphagnum magellanicum]KAH9566467.1 hypothetical protein CY35_04G130100 [Sphagnum magellanicum]